MTGALPVDAAQDPTQVFFKLHNPAGGTIGYQFGSDVALVKQVAGSYYVHVNANVDGTWRYRWESTGTGQAASESAFYVRSEFY